MTQKRRNILVFSGIAAGFLYLFLYPKQASTAITDGLTLCARTIAPSMFPYFVLSDLFLTLGCAEILGRRLARVMQKFFGVSGQGAAPLLLGLVGGYPLGAKTIAELYSTKQLSDAEARKLLFFCCNAGPAFIIGVVGGALYHSAAIGLALYLIHGFSAVLCGLLPCANPKRKKEINTKVTPQPLPFSSALIHAVDSALKTTLKVSSFIVLFSLLIGIEKQIFSTGSVFSVILSGLTELSTGCAALAGENLSWQLKFTLTSAFLSFGGLCVLCQTLSAVSETGLPIKPYLFGKTLQTFFSAVLAYPVSFFLAPAVPTSNFSVLLEPASPFPWNLLPLTLLLLIFLQLPPRNSPDRAL